MNEIKIKLTFLFFLLSYLPIKKAYSEGVNIQSPQEPYKPYIYSVVKENNKLETSLNKIKVHCKDFLKWSKKHYKSIAASLLSLGVISLGLYKYWCFREATITLRDDYTEPPHEYDGKLPNGQEGPLTLDTEEEGVKIKITQYPALKQTKCYCGFYALYFLLCLSTGNYHDLSNRQLYQEYVNRWKKCIKKRRPGSIDLTIGEGPNEDLNKDFTWLSNNALVYLINEDKRLERLKTLFNEENPVFNAAYFFIIHKNRNHWIATKSTVKNKNFVEVEIVDSNAVSLYDDEVKEAAKERIKLVSQQEEQRSKANDPIPPQSLDENNSQ